MVSRPYNGFPAAFRDKVGGRVYRAFKSGKIKRPTECIMCHLTVEDGATIQAHNEDYHEPYTYVGICFYCHMAIHKRFGRGLPAWKKYRAAVIRGWQPPRNRDYRRFAEWWETLEGSTALAAKEPSDPDYGNWSWLLPDVEPDLYTERATSEDAESLW